MVWLDNRRQGIREDITSYPNFWTGAIGTKPSREWRDDDLNLPPHGVGEPEEIRAASVSANFFQLMGVSPRGRGFTAEEEQPGRDRIVVLSHGLWQRRFGGDPGILNKTISLNGESTLVVGNHAGRIPVSRED